MSYQIILYFLFLLSFFPPAVDLRLDEEIVQTSFNGQIRNFNDPQKKCEIKVGGEWIVANESVSEPFMMPTCLKDFYKLSHLRMCGKSMYSRFAYCAKTAKKRNNEGRLLLIDGCLRCIPWKERAFNVSIQLRQADSSAELLAETKSDIYADFKIGALLSGGNSRFLELVLKHRCNQYDMFITKKIKLPFFDSGTDYYENTWESVNTLIPLMQEANETAEVDFYDLPGKNY